ncbi:hypothetical protein [Streptomyces sp. 900105245]
MSAAPAPPAARERVVPAAVREPAAPTASMARGSAVPFPPAAPARVVVGPPVVRGRAAGDPPPPRATGARRLAADPEAVDAVGEALAALHRGAAPGARVPVVLSAGDYSVHAAGTFAAHCDDPGRRLRPADSVGLEPSGLLRRFTELTGWRGPGYVIAEPAGDGTAALRFARALAAGRAPAVYLCEVLRRPDTGAFWAVAARVRRATTQPPRPDDAPPAPFGTPASADAAAGLDAETRRRSAVLRAHLRPCPHDPAEEQQ